MNAVHNSVETVNAAATAIVTAESRVQPTTHRFMLIFFYSFSVNGLPFVKYIRGVGIIYPYFLSPFLSVAISNFVYIQNMKKRWGSCWSLYGCFKTQNHSKKLNHAALVPEPLMPLPVGHRTESLPHTTTILIVPPSSPFQSDPPSATQTPNGPLSSNPHSPPGNPVFATGPYANETNPVSPPVFSTFTTEPSSSSFTPPIESPDIPFAQKLKLSQYDFQPYQQHIGSPIRNLVSPGSVVSNSGTSSPYLDKNFSLKFQIGEVPKMLSLENFSIRNWASRDRNADVASLADNDVVTNHRLSFELNREDVAREEGICEGTEEEESSKNKYRSISFGSIKEFDFDNSKGEFPEKSEWWANEKIIGEDLDSQNNWTFFPLLKPGVV